MTLPLLFLSLWILPMLGLAYRARGRSLTDTAVLAALIALYVVHHRDFVLAREFVFHDTLWGNHGFYAVVVDWLASGHPIGWNSFLEGGEPLYVLSNSFLWAELVGFATLNRLFGIETHALVNLYFSYILISFAVFCFCLFSAVLRDRLLCFYALIPVLFGGLTVTTYAQYVLSPLYLLPLALLCAYRAVAERRVLPLAWLAFFVAVSANHYLPHYLALSAGVFVACAAAAVEWNRDGPPKLPTRPGRTLVRVGAVALLAVAAAAPAVFVSRELGGWVAPTRGNVVWGQYGQGQQPSVNVALDQYEFLVTLPRIDPGESSWENLAYHHSPFFIGWIPVALALYSLTALGDPRYRPWLLSAAVLALVALGQPPGLWATLRAHVPHFHVRHLYPLALTITVLIVMLSAFGLRRLPVRRALKLAICGAALVTGLAAPGRNSYADARFAEPFAVAPFRYPESRALYSRRLGPVPLDVEPLVSKRAAATHRRDDFVLLRAGAYHRLLAEGLPVIAGPMFAVADRLDWAPPPFEQATNLLANGSFETWAPDSFAFATMGAPAKLYANRDPGGVRSGSASLRVDLPGGGRAVLHSRVPVEGHREFAVIGACLKGTERVSAMAVVEFAPISPDPRAGPRRVPQEDTRPISVLHEYDGRGTWECFRRVVSLDRRGEDVGMNLWLASERPATIYVDDLELRPVPARAFRGPTPLPIDYVETGTPDHLVVRVRMPADGYLVRRENFHPRWRVRVDGAERPIERYAGALQAVRLERGTHTVAWDFGSPYPAFLWTHVGAVFAGYVAFALSAIVDGGAARDGPVDEGGRSA